MRGEINTAKIKRAAKRAIINSNAVTVIVIGVCKISYITLFHSFVFKLHLQPVIFIRNSVVNRSGSSFINSWCFFIATRHREFLDQFVDLVINSFNGFLSDAGLPG